MIKVQIVQCRARINRILAIFERFSLTQMKSKTLTKFFICCEYGSRVTSLFEGSMPILSKSTVFRPEQYAYTLFSGDGPPKRTLNLDLK